MTKKEKFINDTVDQLMEISHILIPFKKTSIDRLGNGLSDALISLNKIENKNEQCLNGIKEINGFLDYLRSHDMNFKF